LNATGVGVECLRLVLTLGPVQFLARRVANSHYQHALKAVIDVARLSEESEESEDQGGDARRGRLAARGHARDDAPGLGGG
jgi:hypothetical protein